MGTRATPGTQGVAWRSASSGASSGQHLLDLCKAGTSWWRQGAAPSKLIPKLRQLKPFGARTVLLLLQRTVKWRHRRNLKRRLWMLSGARMVSPLSPPTGRPVLCSTSQAACGPLLGLWLGTFLQATITRQRACHHGRVGEDCRHRRHRRRSSLSTRASRHQHLQRARLQRHVLLPRHQQGRHPHHFAGTRALSCNTPEAPRGQRSTSQRTPVPGQQQCSIYSNSYMHNLTKVRTLPGWPHGKR